MKKNLKRIIFGTGVLCLVVLAGYYLQRLQTKSYSPEDTVAYQQDDLQMEVFYNRPYKKNREIFGGLVPYGEVWRTGANEATTFQTNENIMVDGSFLPAGKYTLWTIPGEDSWKVIFNSEMYPWGITLDKVPSRLPEHDVLTIEVPVEEPGSSIEQFSIYFQETNELIEMILAWDMTVISIPIIEASQTMMPESISS
ncbi:DUF2911 domain-containing protein [Salinimicrobium sp. GXAS 041]|uniref:DUF2911 domain-containing protein n=1 Tax=Salinimicrobium sp. GXAS 041 TaxID=3400806 RepID=UPI003C77C97D